MHSPIFKILRVLHRKGALLEKTEVFICRERLIRFLRNSARSDQPSCKFSVFLEYSIEFQKRYVILATLGQSQFRPNYNLFIYLLRMIY